MALPRWIYKILPIVFLLLAASWLLFGDFSLFGKITGKVDDAKEYLPNVSIGIKESNASKSVLSEDHQQEVGSLQAALNKLIKPGNKDCFVNYGGFSSLGEKGTSLEMGYMQEEESTEVIVKGGKGGAKIIKEEIFVVKGMTPCVIAGSEGISENFYDKIIDGERVSGNYYQWVPELKIKYFSAGDRFDGNVIRSDALGSDAINDEGNNLNDGGWLFTPDGKHGCFFPTKYGNNACDGDGDDGLDDDCLEDVDEEDTIPYLINSGRLARCPE